MNKIIEKLIREIQANNILKVEKILVEHPNIVNNYKDNDDWTALMYASQDGFTNCLRLLLWAGANPNLQTMEGMTALMLASEYGSKNHTECVSILLQAGADINLKTNNGFTVLMVASECGHAGCVQLLLRAGANPDPNIKNNYNENAYDLAANEDIKKLLRKAINLWSLMPLYLQSYQKNRKIPTDLVREVFEKCFNNKIT